MQADRRALSLAAMMKLIVFAAVACLCVTSMVRPWQGGVVDGGSTRGLVVVFVFELIVVPLAWVVTSVFLIRNEALRDQLITHLLFVAVTVALGAICLILVSFTIPVMVSDWKTSTEMRPSLVRLGLNLAMVAILSPAFGYLLRKLRGRARRAS